MKNNYSISLYTRNGQRKYMNANERKKFYSFALKLESHKKLFHLMLYHSGARISEVLNLQSWQIDKSENLVIIESLKKRKKGIYRAVPLPKTFIRLLDAHISLNAIEGLIWSFSRSTASRYIKATTNELKIIGAQASAKGLRHSFAVAAIENNIPLNLIKIWMGHSSLSTTEIYLSVVGQEERNFAKRMWNH